MSEKEGKRGFAPPQAALSGTALFKLRKAEVIDASSRADAAWETYRGAERRAHGETPPPGDLMLYVHVGQGHRIRLLHDTEDKIRKACVWYKAGVGFTEGEEQAQRLTALAHAWRRQREKLERKYRVEQLEAAWRGALQELGDARRRLAAAPAPDAGAIADKIEHCFQLWGGLCHDTIDALTIGEAMAGDADDGMGLVVALYLDALRIAKGETFVAQLIAGDRVEYAADVARADAEAAKDRAEAERPDDDGFSARAFWLRAKDLGAFFYIDRGAYGWKFPQPPSAEAKAMLAEIHGDKSKREAVFWVARTEFEGGADD